MAASKNKYAIYSNSNANALDIQIESVGGSMRVTNGVDTRFKIDYLGNTIFSGSNVGFSNCISFGPSAGAGTGTGTGTGTGNTFCAVKTGLDMSGPIRMTGNLQLERGIVFPDSAYVGPLIERRDLSARYGMSTTTNETRVYAGNSGASNKVSLGFTDASGYTSRLTIPQSGASTFVGNVELAGSGKLSASQLALGNHTLIPDGDWLRGGSMATTRFMNGTSATFNGSAEFANGIMMGSGSSIGIAPYGSVARFHGSLDATTQLALGFRGAAADSWDDRISITNSPKKVDIKGDVNIVDGGSLTIGNYKMGIVNNKLTIRDPSGAEVWSVPSK